MEKDEPIYTFPYATAGEEIVLFRSRLQTSSPAMLTAYILLSVAKKITPSSIAGVVFSASDVLNLHRIDRLPTSAQYSAGSPPAKNILPPDAAGDA
ncbi:MAG: hypothetical protein C5S52_00210 [ANME-2 cluster archaeon]|nr:hypothetical protein [ANME-2 cluster archaeon]